MENQFLNNYKGRLLSFINEAVEQDKSGATEPHRQVLGLVGLMVEEGRVEELLTALQTAFPEYEAISREEHLTKIGKPELL